MLRSRVENKQETGYENPGVRWLLFLPLEVVIGSETEGFYGLEILHRSCTATECRVCGTLGNGKVFIHMLMMIDECVQNVLKLVVSMCYSIFF